MNLSNNFTLSQHGLQQLQQRGFEIVFSQFENMCSSSDIVVQEFVHTIGKEEFYESLKFEFNVLYSLIYTKNIELLQEFYIWQYSVYFHRGLDCDIFLRRFEFWQNSFFANLHRSYASALNHIYEKLKDMHTNTLTRAKEIPSIKTAPKDQNLIDELSLYLLNGKEKQGYELIQSNLHRFEDIYTFIDAIIKPIMKRVGILWQINEISVAKEHLATATIDTIIHKFMQKQKTVVQKRSVVVSTVGDELHTFALKLISDFLVEHDYEVINLGLRNKPRQIYEQTQALQPELVILSTTLHSNIAAMQETVSLLKADPQLQTKVIVGGQALYEPKTITIEDADFQSSSLQDLKQYLLL